MASLNLLEVIGKRNYQFLCQSYSLVKTSLSLKFRLNHPLWYSGAAKALTSYHLISQHRTKAHKSDEELNFMMAVDYAISTFCHTWSIIPRLVQTWTIEKLIPQLDILPSFSIFTLASSPPVPRSLSPRTTPVYLMRELRTFFRCFSHPPFQSIRFLFTTRLTYGGILCVRLPICVKSLGAHTRASVNFKNCVFLSR